MNNEKNNVYELYSKISNDLIYKFKASGVNPNDVSIDTGISSETMLDLLFNADKGDFLAYREIDSSIKRLTKNRSDSIDFVAKK
jgi:hypothetical protein